ncbi:PTS system mannose/fructose/sorbose family transporter subunit IID [Enterococcus alcedinis]|uniref:PTS N-acetylglucosamine transporter subunit IIBC n=1 Tax=Enterococcus alcedinis TaxID=1274384 RepID=A0A917JG69_9ENTE|nr:PTS system mannose/fructose/sorbose family transporter subunit IID [Enterococcus alcedinis]MBP2101376.1 PTS system N-acetylgalactosamine-specific IID component [Enterococcus alcedinis]GGI65232.1 PTS N-acetylglucosamine transporter subunit IIBC [Enterococcus alcedinis]
MESKNLKLTQKDYIGAALRSYLLQNSFNYNSYQGIGYLYSIMPGLQKIYADDQEQLKEKALANIEFYNVNPHMAPFVTSMQLAMYDHGEDIEDARSIKMALMGPLSGIGDSIAQFGIAPLFSTIFAGLAMDGMGFAPMGFWTSMLVSMFIIKISMGYLGFKLGTSIIDTLSTKISKISAAANIVGVTVIAGLATTFVKANIPIQYVSQMADGTEQVVALQEILDKIMPKLLSVVITIIVYYLIKKRNWTTYRLLALLFTIGILGSVLGVLG